MNIKTHPSLPQAPFSGLSHHGGGCSIILLAQRALRFTGGQEPPPHDNPGLITDSAAGNRAAHAGETAGGVGGGGLWEAGHASLGKDLHQLWSEPWTSCLICYNHYESYSDSQGARRASRGPASSASPGQPFPLCRHSQRMCRGVGGGRGELNCRQQHQLLARPMGGFLMCNVLVTNTLIVARGARMWEGGLLPRRLDGGLVED